MKKITELTEQEAERIFNYVFPKSKYEYSYFNGVSFESIPLGEGQQVGMDMRPIVGILYNNGQDNCVLHFDHSKVVLWLYEHGYDILELLKENKHMSELENDFENFAFQIHLMSTGNETWQNSHKQNWTLDYVKEKCTKLLNEYYYKNYE